MKSEPDIALIYAVLRKWVTAGKPRPQSYSQLSFDYHERTGEWYEPHGSWDAPLGELNKALASVGAPALSAFVLLQGKDEPGNGFWGSAPNVPHRPATRDERLMEWLRIVNEVISYNWPPSLP